MRNLLILIIVGLFFPSFVKGQDTILMNTGKTKIVNIKELNQRLLYVSYTKLNSNNTKAHGNRLPDVFSVSFKDSARIITYVQDSNLDLVYTEDQMHSYVKGEQFALNHYKAPWVTVGGVVFGAVSPFALTYYLALIPPAAYTGLSSITSIQTRKLAKKYPEYYADPYFVDGFKQKVKRKNIMNAVYGSVIGLGVAGILTGILTLTDK
jgi:hypothetical protein